MHFFNLDLMLFASKSCFRNMLYLDARCQEFEDDEHVGKPKCEMRIRLSMLYI